MERALLDGLSVLLCYTQPQWVLEEARKQPFSSPAWKQYCKEEEFLTSFRAEHPERSGIEGRHVLEALRSSTEHPEYPDRGIFTLILSAAQGFLRVDGGEVQCRHEKMVEWRLLTQQTGQALFLCAFLAWNDLRRGQVRTEFAFSPYAKSDHLRLRHMLSLGMSENHFHLKGSAPAAFLSWVCLMNHIDRRNGPQGFGNHMFRRALAGKNSEDSDWSDYLYRLTSTSACLRLILWRSCTGGNPAPLLQMLEKNRPWDPAACPLHALWTHQLQEELRGERLFHGQGLDYLRNATASPDNTNHAYAALAGENRLLYVLFRRLFQDAAWAERYGSLFYAYLLIFICFRRELTQCNQAYGFDNFEAYQNRKELFLTPPYQKELIRMAYTSVLSNSAIKSLEARVVLPSEPGKLRKKLRFYMDSIPAAPGEVLDRTSEKKDERVFLVIHLPKDQDLPLKHGLMPAMPCRHQKYRNGVVWPEIYALAALFRRGDRIVQWIRGVDACSQEIACRPEVFAPAFRYLRYMAVAERSCLMPEVPPLRFTYHVGEDFLDVTDGLRAIDEAVRYLRLGAGDRLGHALAMGIDPGEWYAKRFGSLVLPAQDTLDNTAWLLYVLQRLNWQDEPLRQRLWSWYDTLCGRIYGQQIPLTQYRQAWLLRGDEPSYYREAPAFPWGDDRDRLSPDPRCRELRERDKTVCELYRRYHYDPEVRRLGAELTAFTLPPGYSQAVQAAQMNLRERIARRKIGIETNPSSNYLIGRFGEYEQHPIVTFNDLYLREPSQKSVLFVSINTDDQGVFDTDLENEFSLMASALENARDSNGVRLYTPEQVYRWIDQVRQMGLEQAFRQN